MAANTNRAGKRSTSGRKNGKKKSNQNLKIVIFIIEILIIIGMLLVVWKVWDTTEGEGYTSAEFEEDDIHINPGVASSIENDTTDSGTSEDISINASVSANTKQSEYWNIALFGLDATSTSQLQGKSRSDCIIIASIHKETGEIKLVSVYRDTYMNLSNDKYTKCNAAYSTGGASRAISMLNMNLDLAITDFVAVGYSALADCVDALGGVWIDVDSAELEHINNYQQSIIADVSHFTQKDYVEVTTTGYQRLTGLQAAAYCRIRYTAGNDFKRAERQREVIKAMVEEAQKMDLNTLLEIVKVVAPNVYTSFDLSDTAEMTELLKNINNYEIVDEGGFPHESMRTTADIGSANCIVPLSLESNVVWLHEFLFGEEDYQVTDEVKECSDTIEANTSKYINKVSN